MRQRKQELIITFNTTTAAMKMEKTAKLQEKKGRIIPLPTQVNAGCGMAFLTAEGMQTEWQEFCHKHAIEFNQICEVWL